MNRFISSVILIGLVTCQLYARSYKVFVDHEHIRDINTIIKNDSLFRDTSNYKLNFGFKKFQVWLKFEKENRSNTDTTLVLSITYPLLNEIEYFEFEDGVLIKNIVTGDNYPYKSRDVESRDFAFKIRLKPHTSKDIYFRIYNMGETIRIPVSDETMEEFYTRSLNDKFALSPYYGFILFGVIFNILLFLSLRDKVYIYFSLYILSLALFLANIDGIPNELFWPGLPWWGDRSTISFIGLVGIFFLAFTREFLKMTTLFPIIDKLFNILIAICIVTFLSSLIPRPYYTFSVKFANMFTFLYVVFAIVVAIIAWIKKYKPARVFSISFIILMSGVVLYILRNIAVLPHNAVTANGVKIGIAIQIMFLSFAVSERFRKIMFDTQNQLELEVQIRTATLEAQRDFLRIQNTKIEQQHKEITDSIIYAERIQKAALPSKEFCDEVLKDYFSLYLPCNIVSGDFYWISQNDDDIYISVADCTGHGVPGGFLSMLGISFLNEISTNHFQSLPNELLDELKKHFINTLTVSDGNYDTKDGMDIAICKINSQNLELNYAGAHIPAYIVRDKQIIELKGDPMPVGKYIKEMNSFSNQNFQLQKDDMLYLFSDGYSDQLGGEAKKKLKKKAFKQLLLDICLKDCSTQKQILKETFHQWKGTNIQIDDVLVLGLKI